MSVFALYAPTKVCETEEKMFYAKLDSVLDQCPRRNAHVVLGDLNAVIGTEFFATNHRLVVASLKRHVKSTKTPRCDHTVFHRPKTMKYVLDPIILVPEMTTTLSF